MTTNLLRQKFRKAQAVPFPGVRESINSNIHDLLTAHCNAVGCPEEFLFVPFLSTCAGFMGAETQISFHSEWKEPAILWTIVAASKGERKSPALKRIKDAILNIQSDETKIFTEQNVSPTETPSRTKINLNSKSPPQLLIDVFSMEELHSVLLRNKYQIIGVYEEIKVLHQCLDIYKPGGSLIDRKQFLNLNGGSQWDRNFKNSGYSHCPKTHFNHTGMIQPLILAEMFNKEDWDGFNDRYLISCPKEVHFTSADYVVPIPDDQKNGIEAIFRLIRVQHQNKNLTYTFTEEAKTTFNDYHDNYYLPMRSKYMDDENKRGVLSKSLGYIIRLSGVLTAITNASNANKSVILDDDISLNSITTTFITHDTVNKAIQLMYYFTDTKFCLLPEIHLTEEYNISQKANTEQPDLIKSSSNKLKRLLEFDDEDKIIIPAQACRNALIPPVKKEDRSSATNKFPTWAAENFFREVCKMGLGDIVEKRHALNKTSCIGFKKRKFCELGETEKDLITKLHINTDNYKFGTRGFGNNKENTVEIDGDV